MSAWTVIAHTEVPSGGQQGITFDNIPQDGTDLCILFSARSTTNSGTSDLLVMRFNDDSTTYATRTLQDITGTTTSVTNPASVTNYASVGYMAQANWTNASVFSTNTIYIPNYAGTTTKTIIADMGVVDSDANPRLTWIVSSSWDGTTGITKIVFFPLSNNFAQYTSATLYKITRGSSGGVVVS